MRASTTAALFIGALIFGQSTIAAAYGSIDTITAGAAATVTAAAVATPSQAVLVVAAPLASDRAVPHGDDLAARLATVLAGKIGGSARAYPHVASFAAARAAAGHSSALVFVTAQIEKGELRATVDVYPVVANGWDRIRVAAPAPRAHSYVAAPIDAEIRTFLPVILLEQAQVHKAHHDESEVLAAACGDLDGDGGMEIAIVSRARIAVGHVRGKIGDEKFVVSENVAWSQIASRAAVPFREPIGGVAFSGHNLLVGSSDRGSFLLGADLAARESLVGMPVVSANDNVPCAKIDPNSSSLSGRLSSCTLAEASAIHATIHGHLAPDPRPERCDAEAVADVVDRTGFAHRAFAARGLDGKLVVLWNDTSRSFDDVGAQVAVGDLDQDGVPEIITTKNSTDDAIDVWSYDGVQTRERKKIPAPDGVTALAICPPEANGVPALVAVVGSEVWLVR